MKKVFLFTTLIFIFIVSCSNDTTTPNGDDDNIDTTSPTAQAFLNQVKGKTASTITSGNGQKFVFNADGTVCEYAFYTSGSATMSYNYNFKEAVNDNKATYTLTVAGQSGEASFRVDGNTLYYTYEGLTANAGELN